MVNGDGVLHRDSESPVVIRVSAKGWSVSDTGKGMNEAVLLESFLPPRSGSKDWTIPADAAEQARTNAKLHWETGVESPREAVPSHNAFQVNGITVSCFESEGLQLPKILADELPAWSWIPESRNQVVLDDYSIATLDSLINKVLAQPALTSAQKSALLNGLYATILHLAGATPSAEAQNLLNTTRQRVREWAKATQEKEPVVFLPARDIYLHIQTPQGRGRRFLHPHLVVVDPTAAGFHLVPQFEPKDGTRLYSATFTGPEKDSEVLLEEGKLLIVDERYLEWLLSQPLRALLFNLRLNFWIGYGPKKPSKGILRVGEKTKPLGLSPLRRDAVLTKAVADAGYTLDTVPDSLLVRLRSEISDDQNTTVATSKIKGFMQRITVVREAMRKAGAALADSSEPLEDEHLHSVFEQTISEDTFEDILKAEFVNGQLLYKGFNKRGDFVIWGHNRFGGTLGYRYVHPSLGVVNNHVHYWAKGSDDRFRYYADGQPDEHLGTFDDVPTSWFGTEKGPVVTAIRGGKIFMLRGTEEFKIDSRATAGQLGFPPMTKVADKIAYVRLVQENMKVFVDYQQVSHLGSKETAKRLADVGGHVAYAVVDPPRARWSLFIGDDDKPFLQGVMTSLDPYFSPIIDVKGQPWFYIENGNENYVYWNKQKFGPFEAINGPATDEKFDGPFSFLGRSQGQDFLYVDGVAMPAPPNCEFSFFSKGVLRIQTDSSGGKTAYFNDKTLGQKAYRHFGVPTFSSGDVFIIAWDSGGTQSLLRNDQVIWSQHAGRTDGFSTITPILLDHNRVAVRTHLYDQEIDAIYLENRVVWQGKGLRETFFDPLLNQLHLAVFDADLKKVTHLTIDLGLATLKPEKPITEEQAQWLLAEQGILAEHVKSLENVSLGKIGMVSETSNTRDRVHLRLDQKVIGNPDGYLLPSGGSRSYRNRAIAVLEDDQRFYSLFYEGHHVWSGKDKVVDVRGLPAGQGVAFTTKTTPGFYVLHWNLMTVGDDGYDEVYESRQGESIQVWRDKPVFAARSGSVWTVFVGEEKLWWGPGELTSMATVGNRLIFVVQQGDRTVIFVDGHKYWERQNYTLDQTFVDADGEILFRASNKKVTSFFHGGRELISYPLEELVVTDFQWVGHKLVFSARTRADEQKLFVDGEKWIDHADHIELAAPHGNEPLFVVQEKDPERNVLYRGKNVIGTYQGTLDDLTPVGDGVAYSVQNDGRVHVYLNNNVLGEAEGYDYVKSIIPVDSGVVFLAVRDSREYVVRGKRTLWEGPAKAQVETQSERLFYDASTKLLHVAVLNSGTLSQVVIDMSRSDAIEAPRAVFELPKLEYATETEQQNLSRNVMNQVVPDALVNAAGEALLYLPSSVLRRLTAEQLKSLTQAAHPYFPDIQRSFFRFVANAVTNIQDEARLAITLERWTALFQDKSSQREALKLVDDITRLDLWSMLADPVASKKAPTSIQYWLNFLAGQADLVTEVRPNEPSAARTVKKLPLRKPISLARLVMAQRLHIELRESPPTIAGLKAYLKLDADRQIHSYLKDIRSAVTGQDSKDANLHLWLRELTQNARDAIRKARAAGRPLENAEIKIDTWQDKTSHRLGARVRDPVGMELQEILNNVFPLDSSDAPDGYKKTGKFGMGFYTVFAKAEEVELRTRKPGAPGYKIRLRMVRDRDGHLQDVEVLQLDETGEGDFVGTEVVAWFDTRDSGNARVEIEASRIAQMASYYLGTLPTDEARVLLNGQPLHEELEELASVSIPGLQGKLRVLWTDSGFNRVVQDGLFVSAMDLESSKYLALVPSLILQHMLRFKGLVIELPHDLPLTRTRNAPAQEEKYLDLLQRAIAVGTLNACTTLALFKGIRPPDLPQDYLYLSQLKHFISPVVMDDAKLLNDGHWTEVKDLTRYQHNSYDLIQLLTLLMVPHLSQTDKKLSLQSIQDRVQAGEIADSEALSAHLQKEILFAEREVRRSQDKQKNRDYHIQETAAVEFLSLFSESVFNLLGLRPYKFRFFHGTEADPVADIYPLGKELNWNLHYAIPLYTAPIIDSLNNPALFDALYSAVYGLVEALAHEGAHPKGKPWSHQAEGIIAESFARHMKVNLTTLLRRRFDIAPQLHLFQLFEKEHQKGLEAAA